MAVDETKITVADLVATLDRIDQWIGAVKNGLEALPQDQEIEIDISEFQADLKAKQPFRKIIC